MDPLTLMFISTIMSSVLPAIVANQQQQNEFGQQKDLLNQQQEYNSEREDLAYQRQKPQQMYSDYLATGFNPQLAAQAVLGGSSETASLGGSPSAPTVNSAIDALSRSLGQSGDKILDSYYKNAQIENLEANTNKTQVEAGLLPRDYMLRSLSVTKQLEVWDASIKKVASEIKLNDEQVKYIKQQNLYYGRLSEAQIQVYQSEVSENLASARLSLQKVNESKKNMQVMDSEIEKNRKSVDLMDSEIAVNEAEKSNIIQDTSNKIIQGDYDYQKSERERIAKEFEQKCGGVPLTADAQRYVQNLLIDGKIDDVQKFYEGLFQSALNQDAGSAYGSAIGTPRKTRIGLPFNLYSSDSYDFSLWQNSPIQNVYWNRP